MKARRRAPLVALAAAVALAASCASAPQPLAPVATPDLTATADEPPLPASAAASEQGSAALASVALASASPSMPPRALSPEEALAAVTAERLRRHVEFLASDALEGRNVGQPGLEKAAEYVEQQLREAGVKPAGDRGAEGRGYGQRFDAEGKATRNVLGLIEGSDRSLRDEVVVIGAHFDHLGTAAHPHPRRYHRPRADDSIWNGADDNASGTAVALAVARALAEGGVRCRRSLLFAFFSAEEWGLLGSTFYVEHPFTAPGNHALALNLDMVGRNPRLPLAAQGSGPSVEGLRPVVAAGAKKFSLKVNVYDLKGRVADDSDHYPFHQKKIPFLFFWSGDHGDYHRVTDHADRLDYDRMARIARLVAHIALDACEHPPRRAR